MHSKMHKKKPLVPLYSRKELFSTQKLGLFTRSIHQPMGCTVSWVHIPHIGHATTNVLPNFSFRK
jgi:hypothetical protein